MHNTFVGTKLVLDYKANPSDKALDKIVEQYSNMIHKHCNGIIVKSAELEPLRDDLIQCGIIGLLTAVENYNKDIAKSFTTIAHYYVWGYMMHFVRNEPRDVIGVRMSNGAANTLNNIYKKYTDISQKLGRTPVLEELVYANKANPELCELVIRIDKHIGFSYGTNLNEETSEPLSAICGDEIESHELIANIHLLQKQGFTMQKICNILGIKNMKALKELITLHSML